MSELPIAPFPAPAGLVQLGAEDVGICVDGVCAVPESPAASQDAAEER